ncbi:hypothetical protein FM106_23580 [Brachybacterium faecium]|nr:hypothetical protein FM106_23580 [Brachybacterium faecium]
MLSRPPQTGPRPAAVTCTVARRGRDHARCGRRTDLEERWITPAAP